MGFNPNLAPGHQEASLSSAITAVSQSLITQVSSDKSNWIVQVTGTWVGTLIFELSADGGNNYVAVNARQSLAGRIGNNTSSNGLFRGCVAGGSHFRVRSSAWTSGTANVTVRLSPGVSPIFMNSIVEVRLMEQYFASVSGGNAAFTGSVGAVSIASTGGLVCTINNPSGATTDAYIARVVVGANKAGRFERWRVTGNPTIGGAFTPMANTGGNPTNTSTAKMYSPSSATITGGTLTRTTFLDANSSDENIEDGASILRPGQSLYWNYTPDTNQTALATVSISFWETNAVT